MKHLSGAILALTVAPIAVVLAQPLTASAAGLATCAGTQAALSTQGSSANSVRASAGPEVKRTNGNGQLVLSGSSHQRICAPTAPPRVLGGSGRETNYPRPVTDYLRAGSRQDLATETGSDARLGTPRTEAPQDPEPGKDGQLPPAPADASGPTAPRCAEALAAEPDPTDASTGADFPPSEEVTTANADGTCGSGNVFTDPAPRTRMDPADQAMQSTARDEQPGSDTSTLPYTGATAATTLTFALGATGGGLLLIAGSLRRRRKTS